MKSRNIKNRKVKRIILALLLVIGASNLFAQNSYMRILKVDQLNVELDEIRVENKEFDWFVYPTGSENQHLVFTGTSIENGLYSEQEVIDSWKINFLISLYQEYEFKTIKIGSSSKGITKNKMIEMLGGGVSE